MSKHKSDLTYDRAKDSVWGHVKNPWARVLKCELCGRCWDALLHFYRNISTESNGLIVCAECAFKDDKYIWVKIEGT